MYDIHSGIYSRLSSVGKLRGAVYCRAISGRVGLIRRPFADGVYCRMWANARFIWLFLHFLQPKLVLRWLSGGRSLRSVGVGGWIFHEFCRRCVFARLSVEFLNGEWKSVFFVCRMRGFKSVGVVMVWTILMESVCGCEFEMWSVNKKIYICFYCTFHYCAKYQVENVNFKKRQKKLLQFKTNSTWNRFQNIHDNFRTKTIS